jgi:uncharacterized protein YndB with AHSA1/START domain
MTDDHSIELEVEVPGSADEVWRAVATGEGISSWYVPHTVDEREGGAATARFGPGPDMEVPGRVASWDPPRRIVFEGGEDAGEMSFEWTVEERETTCVVRLVNDGFGEGEDWESQYEAMTAGWKMFLTNLAMHLEHFAGRSATPSVPSTMWDTSRDDAWRALTAALGLPSEPTVGEVVGVSAHDAPSLAGTVVETTPWRMSLLLHDPAPGTALIAAEAMGDQVAMSVWTYLYGTDGSDAAARDEPRWQVWLERHAPS